MEGLPYYQPVETPVRTFGYSNENLSEVNGNNFSLMGLASPRKGSAMFTKAEYNPELKRTRTMQASGVNDNEVQSFLSPSRIEGIDCPPALLDTVPPPPTAMQGVRYISPHTLAALIRQRITVPQGFEIFDVRYEYEHDGGHIGSAVNCPTTDRLMHWLFNMDRPLPCSTCIIVHCEHSECRAPRQVSAVLQRDQLDCSFSDTVHANFPQVYVLAGGYAQFYQLYPNLCCGGYASCRPEDEALLQTSRTALSVTGLELDLAPLQKRSMALDSSRDRSRRASRAATPRKSFDFDSF